MVLAAWATPAAARPDACSGHGRRTLHVNRVTRVVEKDGAVSACWRATGRSTRLFLSGDIYEDGRVDYVSQRWVAYEREDVPACKADCPPGVTTSYEAAIVDVRTGRRTVLTRSPVSVLVVTTTGGAAWLEGDGPGATLYAGVDRSVLADGDIPAGSVKLHGHTVRWTAGGRPGSAPLT